MDTAAPVAQNASEKPNTSNHTDGDHDSGVDENTQRKDGPTTNGDFTSPTKSPSKIPAPKKLSTLPSPTKSVKGSPKTPEAPPTADKKKVPMNKIQVGAAPSPNLKTVKSKIGSLQNATHKPGGGNVKIEHRKLDWKAEPRIAAKNDAYQPGGGDKKIPQVKLKWEAKPKVGSLDNATHKPGGGEKKIESVKLDFKDKAKPKVGSKDNIKHQPGGGNIKIEDQKLDVKAQSKIGSLDNVKHKPGGGDRKIFDDKDYLRQMSGSTSRAASEGIPSGTQVNNHRSSWVSSEYLHYLSPYLQSTSNLNKQKSLSDSYVNKPKIENLSSTFSDSKSTSPTHHSGLDESPLKFCKTDNLNYNNMCTNELSNTKPQTSKSEINDVSFGTVDEGETNKHLETINNDYNPKRGYNIIGNTEEESNESVTSHDLNNSIDITLAGNIFDSDIRQVTTKETLNQSKSVKSQVEQEYNTQDSLSMIPKYKVFSTLKNISSHKKNPAIGELYDNMESLRDYTKQFTKGPEEKHVTNDSVPECDHTTNDVISEIDHVTNNADTGTNGLTNYVASGRDHTTDNLDGLSIEASHINDMLVSVDNRSSDILTDRVLRTEDSLSENDHTTNDIGSAGIHTANDVVFESDHSTNDIRSARVFEANDVISESNHSVRSRVYRSNNVISESGHSINDIGYTGVHATNNVISESDHSTNNIVSTWVNTANKVITDNNNSTNSIGDASTHTPSDINMISEISDYVSNYVLSESDYKIEATQPEDMLKCTDSDNFSSNTKITKKADNQENNKSDPRFSDQSSTEKSLHKNNTDVLNINTDHVQNIKGFGNSSNQLANKADSKETKIKTITNIPWASKKNYSKLENGNNLTDNSESFESNAFEEVSITSNDDELSSEYLGNQIVNTSNFYDDVLLRETINKNNEILTPLMIKSTKEIEINSLSNSGSNEQTSDSSEHCDDTFKSENNYDYNETTISNNNYKNYQRNQVTDMSDSSSKTSSSKLGNRRLESSDQSSTSFEHSRDSFNKIKRQTTERKLFGSMISIKEITDKNNTSSSGSDGKTVNSFKQSTTPKNPSKQNRELSEDVLSEAYANIPHMENIRKYPKNLDKSGLGRKPIILPLGPSSLVLFTDQSGKDILQLLKKEK